MTSHKLLLIIVGIINVLAAIAMFFGARFMLGMSWLGAFDLYVALERDGVFDHTKLAAIHPELAEHYALGDRLITLPVSVGDGLLIAGGAGFLLNAIVLLAGAFAAKRTAGRANEAG